jgi:hypothetical protein
MASASRLESKSVHHVAYTTRDVEALRLLKLPPAEFAEEERKEESIGTMV